MLASFAFNLSWKQKLITLIVVTLLGLILVAGSAYIGFNRVNESVEQQMATSEYKQLSLTFSNDLLSLNASSRELTPDNAAQYKARISSLKENVAVLTEKANGLHDSEMAKTATKLSSVADQYFSLVNAWLDNSAQLGFTLKDGERAKLVAAANEMKRMSFTMTKEQIDLALGTQSSYLNTLKIEDERIIDKALKNLTALVKNMEWEDNMMGKSIMGYAKEYHIVKQFVDKQRELDKQINPVFAQLTEDIAHQNKYLDEVVSEKVLTQAHQAQSSAVSTMLVASLGVGLVIFITLARISRQLNVQLREMQDFLKMLADGDFSQQLELNNNEKDEFTQLRKACNQMTRDIAAVISQVVKGNQALSVARGELQNVVHQLATSSDLVEQQTHSSSEATQQISIAVNDVAKRSGEVRITSQNAADSTLAGSSVINDSVQSIINISELIKETHHEASQLSESNAKMQGIVNVINSLADQTNLLALNAAIESARAGEAGRGFAVVADEVRALAQKTVNATSGISDIINSLNSQSSKMTELMDKGMILASSGQENAGNAIEAIETIESAIQTVTAEMDQVVVAVEEISYNTNDISNQINQISDQSEGNKHIRESLEQHTQHINGQVNELERLTNRFTL
jgi:methyl-accepting chemotaxis protein